MSISSSKKTIFLMLGIIFIATNLRAPMTADCLAVSAIGAGGGYSFSLSMIFFSVRTKNAHDAGRISGMAQSIGYLLAAAGPFLFGLLHDLTDSWSSSLVFLLIVTVAFLLVGLQAGKNRTI